MQKFIVDVRNPADNIESQIIVNAPTPKDAQRKAEELGWAVEALVMCVALDPANSKQISDLHDRLGRAANSLERIEGKIGPNQLFMTIRSGVAWGIIWFIVIMLIVQVSLVCIGILVIRSNENGKPLFTIPASK